MKSIGRSTTLANNITDIEQAKKVMLALSESVGERARRHHKKGTTAHITIKYADFTVVTRQASTSATDLSNTIYQTACTLLKKQWDRRPARLLGVGLSGLLTEETRQISFADLMATSMSPNQKNEKLETVVDRIWEKYGAQKIARASLLESKSKKLPF